jgi:hypothetical protein
MRSVSDKNFRENRKTHFMLSNSFSANRAVYEIMWKKYGKAGQATEDNVFSACALHAGNEGCRQTLVVTNTNFFVLRD